MKKVAVFVEGQAELILVRELLLKMYDYQNVGINCYNLICDNLDEAPYKYGNMEANNYYMIVNVGNDNSVLSKIFARISGLHKKGFTKIIGLRDVYGDFYKKKNKGVRNINLELIEKLKNAAQNEIDAKDLAQYIKLHFAIMEVEAWFIGFNIFERIDATLSNDLIKSKLNYDLENDDPEITYYHPAKIMGDIYGLIGSKYDKHESDVSSLVAFLEKEDYNNLIESFKCSTFTSFVQELLN